MSSRQSHRAATPAAATLALGFTSVIASAAPVPFGGHSYDLVLNDRPSWTDVQDAATKTGGELATITSAPEQSFIESLLSQRTPPTGANFVGLQEVAAPGLFAPIGAFNDFAPGEPNNDADGEDETASTGGTDDGANPIPIPPAALAFPGAAAIAYVATRRMRRLQ